MQFNKIPGQDKIKAKLLQSVKEQRVSHTQLFLGQEGTGKLAMAIAFAQYINCENPSANDSCGVCPSCIKYQKLAHPDLHFIYPVIKTKSNDNPKSEHFASEWRELLLEKNAFISLHDWHEKLKTETKQSIINTADCNSIIQKLSLKSYESEYRVVIMWQVERFYREAAPRLLKILEEPPYKTLFILIAENHDQLLSTIKSRTQLVKFLPYPAQEVSAILRQTFQLGVESADYIAQRCAGNLHKAFQDANEKNNDEKYFLLFRSWMRSCLQAKIYEIQEMITQISPGNREEVKRFLQYGQGLIRDSLMIHHDSGEITYRSGAEKDFVTKFSPFIHPEVMQGFYNEFDEAIVQIGRNGNANIILTDLSFRISNLLHTRSRQP